MTNENAPVGMEQHDFMMAMYIIMQRQYDLLAIIARSANPEVTSKVMEAHAEGHLYAAPPSLAPDEEQ
jgi:hypothetical protein